MTDETKDIENGLEEITGDILDGESEVSDHVVNMEGVTDTVTIEEEKGQVDQAEEKTDSYPGLTDKHGRPFNFEIHHFDEKANFPLLNKTGKAKGKISIKKHIPKPGKKSKVARPKKPKPEPGTKKAGQDLEQEKGIPGEEVKKVSAMTPDMAAQVATAITFRLGVFIGHEEFEPRIDPQTGLDEAKFMRQSYKDYFEAKGVTEVSPGWILVIALTTYIAPRLTMPKTQTRIQRISKSFARGAIWIKYKLSGKAKNGTRADIRDDGERENDTREADSQDIEDPGAGRDSIRPID